MWPKEAWSGRVSASDSLLRFRRPLYTPAGLINNLQVRRLPQEVLDRRYDKDDRGRAQTKQNGDANTDGTYRPDFEQLEGTHEVLDENASTASTGPTEFVPIGELRSVLVN